MLYMKWEQQAKGLSNLGVEDESVIRMLVISWLDRISADTDSFHTFGKYNGRKSNNEG